MKTKDAVLAMLVGEKGDLSGEKISEALGVSRASVNAAVKALREEGCEIGSATNRGYRLISLSDKLRTGEIAGIVGEERTRRVIVLDEADSTNRMLMRMAQEGCGDSQVIIADMQTGGLGRRGRSFVSPPGVGVYFSYYIKPTAEEAAYPTDVWAQLTSFVCVAVSRAIETVCGVKPDIKWVNDLYLKGKKICGILTQLDLEGESGLVRGVVTGIGVNVNNMPEDFPEEIRDIATSIAQVTGERVYRCTLAAEMVRELDKVRREFPLAKAEYLEAYRSANIVPGREVEVSTPVSVRKARALSIGEDFSLLVRYEDGEEEELRSGEVSLKI